MYRHAEALRSIPFIQPVTEGEVRPRWSVMIPIYNRKTYVEQAIRSVLAQDPGPQAMQIEVVDDCSPGEDLEPLVRHVGGGRVAFYRQPRNLGLSGNWTSCIQRATGRLVHILHDDDTVLPGFYARMEAAFECEPAIGAAFCRHIFMDQDGHWLSLSPLEQKSPGILPGWIERIGHTQAIQFPAIAVRRTVYEALGGFHPELFYAVDWEMWKRIAAHYPVWYEPQLLACFRQHPVSQSVSLQRAGANLQGDILKAIDISKSYLPPESAARLSEKARENYAMFALARAHRSAVDGDWAASMGAVREAVQYRTSSRVAGYLVLFLLWAGACLAWRSACAVVRLLTFNGRP